MANLELKTKEFINAALEYISKENPILSIIDQKRILYKDLYDLYYDGICKRYIQDLSDELNFFINKDITIYLLDEVYGSIIREFKKLNITIPEKRSNFNYKKDLVLIKYHYHNNLVEYSYVFNINSDEERKKNTMSLEEWINKEVI